MITTLKYGLTDTVTGKIAKVFVKGAPEVIANMTNDDSFLNTVFSQQKQGRRALSFASGPDLKHLTYDGSVFIEDPVRYDVPESIQDCYKAGINVIMLTGDNITTASEIAKQACFSMQLQTKHGGDKNIYAIEAWEFNSEMVTTEHYPNVIARCTPEDKLKILKTFQRAGYVCAMLGDGVNDSPNLNHANVGIAVGSGTKAAKEASDIVLLDDAFPSIVKGVKWGRSLYKNIQSFLAFQLTVNVALCLTAIFSLILDTPFPFGIIEILYINLVMDALGALALASEPAMSNTLNDPPRNKKESIINSRVARFIGSSGLVLFGVMLILMFVPLELGLTGLFAVFMTFNWLNLFRARALGKNIRWFTGLSRNKWFIGVSLGILITNVLIIQFGGDIFGTEPLTCYQWFKVLKISLGATFTAAVLSFIIKKITLSNG